jgi:hypothetical protein
MDFSCTTQIPSGFQLYRTKFIDSSNLLAKHCRSTRMRAEKAIETIRAIAIEPRHPADERDEAVAGKVDSIAVRQPAANESRSFLSIAPPLNRARRVPYVFAIFIFCSRDHSIAG